MMTKTMMMMIDDDGDDTEKTQIDVNIIQK